MKKISNKFDKNKLQSLGLLTSYRVPMHKAKSVFNNIWKISVFISSNALKFVNY